jgi:uncharacterized protein YigA (DUF484 family)
MNKINLKNPEFFNSEEDMFDFINQHNMVVDRYRRKVDNQEAIIEVLRENISDLIKVINSQEQATDLTDKLMEQDFPIFQKLLDADLGGKF